MEKSLKSAPKSTKNGEISCRRRRRQSFRAQSSSTMAATSTEIEQSEVQVAEGYTITHFHDKINDVFLNEKPQTKDWRKLLVFREECKQYSDKFYKQCKARADAESDNGMKQKLVLLGRKVNKIDDEIERHSELLKEIEQSPIDINAVVAKRLYKHFSVFRHLTLLSETYDNLDDRDAISRLGTRCLSAICVYGNNTVENAGTPDAAEAKFDDILNSPLLDARELDCSLRLLINSAWGAGIESPTMKNEVDPNTISEN
ncbi:hypothetical protein MKX03_024251 [Papaver bracteatum]|nr:hypothetical protein MKX03_024251 [Papaver bracteatum]